MEQPMTIHRYFYLYSIMHFKLIPLRYVHSQYFNLFYLYFHYHFKAYFILLNCYELAGW